MLIFFPVFFLMIGAEREGKCANIACFVSGHFHLTSADSPVQPLPCANVTPEQQMMASDKQK
jgi:hypothetical protein